ncbi:MAG: hypothetical protein HOZ81_39215, partial [Streptomyces sp.]|nr:hypothetical protein [Streptomyces sp.]NUP43377.1 hypothetical protein [Streptomyces sp.]
RDQPERWAGPLLPELVHLAAHQQTHLSPAQAADVVVDMFLYGVGVPRQRTQEPVEENISGP